jgi:hypothetical protein
MKHLTPALMLMVCLATAAQADCTCIYTGGTVKEGETACILTAKGKGLARCEKVLNNTSWTVLDEPCDREQSAIPLNSAPTSGPSPLRGEG